MPSMPGTISDVARRAGVSEATVSRVINGNYPVAAATRDRVMAAVHDLGYVTNALARALTTSTTGTVGVILHDVADPYFAEIVHGINEVAEATGRLVVLGSSRRDPGREIAYIEMLRGQRVDAVILAGGYVENDEFLLALEEQARALRAQGSRLVLCGRYPIRADSVVPTNAEGAFELTTHLLAAGHRRIAHLTGPERLSTSRDRLDGYRGALAAFGLAFDADLVVNGDFSRDGGYTACRLLLEGRPPFTAVFAANDLMAAGALTALREAGRRVPEDVSLVGFDDLPLSRDLNPALTTMAVPMREMGRRSMELALAEPSADIELVSLPTALVRRASVTAPAGSRG